MNFHDAANRMADDSHRPPIDGSPLLVEGKRRVRRRNVVMTSVSLAAVTVLGLGVYAIGQNFLWNQSPPIANPATPSSTPSATAPTSPSADPSGTPAPGSPGEACEAPLPEGWRALLADTTGSITGSTGERVLHVADDGSVVVAARDDAAQVSLHWFPDTQINEAEGVLFFGFDASEGGGINGVDRSGSRYVFNVSLPDGSGLVYGWTPGDEAPIELFTAAATRPVAVHLDRFVYLEQDSLMLIDLVGGDQPTVISEDVSGFIRDGDRVVYSTQADGLIRVFNLEQLEHEALPAPLEIAGGRDVSVRGDAWAWTQEERETFVGWSPRWVSDDFTTVAMAPGRNFSPAAPQVAGELVVLTEYIDDESTLGSVWDLRSNAVTRLPEGFTAEGVGDHVVTYETIGQSLELVAITAAGDLGELTCG